MFKFILRQKALVISNLLFKFFIKAALSIDRDFLFILLIISSIVTNTFSV